MAFLAILVAVFLVIQDLAAFLVIVVQSVNLELAVILDSLELAVILEAVFLATLVILDKLAQVVIAVFLATLAILVKMEHQVFQAIADQVYQDSLVIQALVEFQAIAVKMAQAVLADIQDKMAHLDILELADSQGFQASAVTADLV